jgi:hypothetical protein
MEGGTTSATAGQYQIWDFAGQLEFFPAHQFFLSAANTVYVLVADASKGYHHCRVRLQHWLSFVRSALSGSAAAYGDGASQLAAVRVLVVATHTDTAMFQRHGIDFLPGMCEDLGLQFAPKIAVHHECFRVDYNAPKGGGLNSLQTELQRLREDEGEQAQRIVYPTRYAEAFAALKAAASTPEKAVMSEPTVAEVMSTVGVLDSTECSQICKALGAFGLVKEVKLKWTSADQGPGPRAEMATSVAPPAYLLIEPVSWLTQVTAAFVLPTLTSPSEYEVETRAVPTISIMDVERMLKSIGQVQIKVGTVVHIMEALGLCFHPITPGPATQAAASSPSTNLRGGTLSEIASPAAVIIPALLPRASVRDWPSLCKRVGAPNLEGYGRRFVCSRPEDSVPATFISAAQRELYQLADEVLLLRAGVIVIRLFGCVVAVMLGTSSGNNTIGGRVAGHLYSGSVDIVVLAAPGGKEPASTRAESSAKLGRAALDFVILATVGLWARSYSLMPLWKFELRAEGNTGVAGSGSPLDIEDVDDVAEALPGLVLFEGAVISTIWMKAAPSPISERSEFELPKYRMLPAETLQLLQGGKRERAFEIEIGLLLTDQTVVRESTPSGILDDRHCLFENDPTNCRLLCIASSSDYGSGTGANDIGKSQLRELGSIIQKLDDRSHQVVLPAIGHERVVPIEHCETMVTKLQDLAASVKDERIPSGSTSNIVLQFCGHGTDTSLLFTNPKGDRVEPVSAVLAELIAGIRPCCIILNACDSQPLGEAIVAACGTAPPAVMCWSSPVRTSLCVTLSEAFYSALGRGLRHNNGLEADCRRPLKEVVASAIRDAETQLAMDPNNKLNHEDPTLGQRVNVLQCSLSGTSMCSSGGEKDAKDVAAPTDAMGGFGDSDDYYNDLGDRGQHSLEKLPLSTLECVEPMRGAPLNYQPQVPPKKDAFAAADWTTFVADEKAGVYEVCFTQFFNCASGPSREYWYRKVHRAPTDPHVVMHIHFAHFYTVADNPDKTGVFRSVTGVNARWSMDRKSSEAEITADPKIKGGKKLGAVEQRYCVETGRSIPGSGLTLTGSHTKCKPHKAQLSPAWKRVDLINKAMTDMPSETEADRGAACAQFATDYGIDPAAVSTNEYLCNGSKSQISFHIDYEHAGAHYQTTYRSHLQLGHGGNFRNTSKTCMFKCDGVGWKYLDEPVSTPPPFPTEELSDGATPAGAPPLAGGGAPHRQITLPTASASEFDLCGALRRAEKKRVAVLTAKYPDGPPAYDYESPPALGDPDYNAAAPHNRGGGRVAPPRSEAEVEIAFREAEQ